MTKRSLVTIVIPSHNAAAQIEACLTSCFHQTYPHLEIIVVDNWSIDRTSDLVQHLIPHSPYPIRLLHCPQPGANHARNYGFRQAQGGYIQWLDADDELAPDKIAQQVAALDAQQNYDIAYSDWCWRFYGDRHLHSQFTFTSQLHDDALLCALVNNWQPPHSYLIRRAAADRLHQLQAWHPQTPVSMDREYFTLAALLGYRFLYVPGTTVFYNRWSSIQISRSTPYATRVSSLKAMFDRFQQFAGAQSATQLQEPHRFLLNQEWNLWKSAIAAVTQESATVFRLHDHSGETHPLTYSQAMIAGALLKSTSAATLEDHAYKIVRRLWRAMLRRKGYANAPEFTRNQAAIAQELAHVVGLAESAGTLSQTIASFEQYHPSPTAWIDQMPLYAPLFGEQRLAILRVLDRWRQQGWLCLVPTYEGA